MKFRIKRKRNKKYFPQYKKYIFWKAYYSLLTYDTEDGLSSISEYTNNGITRYKIALDFIENIIEKAKRNKTDKIKSKIVLEAKV
ncbi:hypothetical protein CL614_00375 [archaeon]|nr:hypothetical protein [archaeon]|tara:strand:- start:289 stop:543 length:255 start_codon:yes stop_codon:yes gene_type:complete